MTRGVHLTRDQVMRLRDDLLAGMKNDVLAEKYHISERAVIRHRTKAGLVRVSMERRGRPRDTASHQIAKLCFVAGCFAEAAWPQHFCEKHLPKPPALARMVARR